MAVGFLVLVDTRLAAQVDNQLTTLVDEQLAAQVNPHAPSETDHPVDSTGSLLTGQRVMQTFDFEERDMHLDDLPMYWSKTPPQPGFHHFGGGILDSTRFRSGKFSFKLNPDGGSVGFQYHRKRIPIKPGSDFQIAGFVHLENAPTCRGRITCSFTDRNGKIIPESLHSSELVSNADQLSDGWAPLKVYIPGSFPSARYLTVGIYLLQQQQWNQDEISLSQIIPRDIKAVAWFDDITIYQLPRVILRTSKTSNVFDGREEAVLQIEVEGINSLDYQVQLTVHQANGKLIHDESWLLTGIVDGARTREIVLGDLKAGLYHANLKILSGGKFIANSKLTFARLAPLSGAPATSGINFGVLALDHNAGDFDAIIELTRQSNAKLIKIPVWRRKNEQSGSITTTPDFDRILLELQQNNIQVTAAFSEISTTLALKVDINRRELLDILSLNPEIWRPQVASVLAQYAHQIPYWQIGDDTVTENVSWDPRIRSVIDVLQNEFNKLVSDTVIATTLNGMFQVDLDQVGTSNIALGIPSAVIPSQIPDYIQDCRDRNLDLVWVKIEPLAEQIYSREHRLTDFAKRIIFAKKAHPQAIFINHPWKLSQYNARQRYEPTELLPVFRTFADHLGGAGYVGQFNLAPKVPAMIFDREGTGCLICWNDDYNPKDPQNQSKFKVLLGENVTQIDMFGNRKALNTENSLTELTITSQPVIISGINTALASLRANLKLNPSVVDAGILSREVELSFKNPFKMPISGRFRFLRTGINQQNWLIEPVAFSFTLRPGETIRQPIILKFPRNELGGEKILDTLITLDADRPYRIRQAIPFEIKLTGVELSIFARREGESDLLVQQVVTNVSEEKISLQSFIDLPDSDRLERAIPHLAPGATVTKSFRIKNADQWIGQYLRIGLYDPKGTRRINYNLKIN